MRDRQMAASVPGLDVDPPSTVISSSGPMPSGFGASPLANAWGSVHRWPCVWRKWSDEDLVHATAC